MAWHDEDGHSVMGQNVPPPITVVWCPTCGRTDRYGTLNLPPRKHYAEGLAGRQFCPGKPMRVRYAPIRQGALRR